MPFTIDLPMPKKPAELSRNREISISEFFEKNRHILGFDSPTKALFMTVKEALDNSVDACEEHSILPEIVVTIERISPEEFTVTILDNGPGVPPLEVQSVFGKLLYGSRFHAMRQSRGQQGIGITAAILYGQITTGKHAIIKTKGTGDEVAFMFELSIDISKNEGVIHERKPFIWDREHGTSVSVTLKAKYQTGRQSVFEYLRETAVANPHMDLKFVDPDGKIYHFSRSVNTPPVPSVPAKPHPLGLELGEIQQMAALSQERDLAHFLTSSFNRVSTNVANEILEKSGLSKDLEPASLSTSNIKSLMSAFREVKLMPPPVDCLSPLGPEFIRKGLRNVYENQHPSFYSRPVLRPPSVYNGNPFQIEAGIVYGGDIPADEPVKIIRFVNKVPLLFQQGACAITRTVSELDWRQFGLDQKQGTGIPYGPMIIMVHVCGTKIPYTSESKEAIADVDVITTEITSALRNVSRDLRRFLNKREKRNQINEKFKLIRELLPSISGKVSSVLGLPEPPIDPVISKIANVVFVTEEFEIKDNTASVKCTIFNYTRQSRSLVIYPNPPAGDMDGPQSYETGPIETSQSFSFTFSVSGISKNYDGTDYYFTGIDPVHVQGAEPLPADWGIGAITVEEVKE